MKTAVAVIGANYGDEGKGLITDYLCSKGAEVVIRINGGAQAGHTVVHVEEVDGGIIGLNDVKIRHVFRHFGSGSFVGAPTYLGPEFVVNPLLFTQEWAELKVLGVTPEVYVHPDCKVTVPTDIVFNQALEVKRGKDRHGSCGVGIFETILRDQIPKYRVRVKDLANPGALQMKLGTILHEYFTKRMATEQVQEPEWYPQTMTDSFFEAVDQFVSKTSEDLTMIQEFDHLLFEGAQGLLLDQHSTDFPHVTPSNTGIQNVIPILQELGHNQLEVIYVTRPYVTRHGNGPLPHEIPEWGLTQGGLKVVDSTNVDHPFQGKLRYGMLDLDTLHRRIEADLHHASDAGIEVTPRIAVTCLDHLIGDIYEYVLGGRVRACRPDIAASVIQRACKLFGLHYQSRGPTRQHVTEYKPEAVPAIA